MRKESTSGYSETQGDKLRKSRESGSAHIEVL
ncbi:hypothetical protein PC114_g17100 [Phytophthora cactorum]|nr:hypothetical protein PC114_g17100 [Phytophthora cactorum]